MRATDPRRRPLRLLAAAFLVLGAFACGDDDGDTIPPVSDTIEIRNGTWHRIRSYSVSGADSCSAPAPDTADVVLCTYDPGVGSDPFGLICDIEQTGAEVAIACSGSLDLFPCRIEYHLEGSGTVTDTTLDLTFLRWTTMTAREGAGEICDSLYADPCTTTVVTSASWTTAEGDSACAEADAPAPSLEQLLNRMVGGGSLR